MQSVFFSLGRRVGVPRQASDFQYVAESLVLVLRWRHFGYVWNWPLGISIVRGGQVERRAIVDVTRWLLWGSWLAALLMLLALAAQCRQKHARKGQVQK